MAWGKQLSESPDTVTDDFKVTRTTNTNFNVILAHSIRSGGSNFTADWELNQDSGTNKHASRYSINGATDSTGTASAAVTTSSAMPDDNFQVGYIFNNGTDEMLIIGWGVYQGTYNTSGIGAGTAPNRIEFTHKFVTAGDLTDFALNQSSSGDIATTTNVSWLGSDMTPAAAVPFAANAQAGSRAEITDNRKMYHYVNTVSSLTGLKSYYKFDAASGNITNKAGDVGSSDSIGSGGDMVITGATYGGTGTNGSSLSFDGTNDYGNIGTSPMTTIGTGDFGISFWIKTDDFAGGGAPCIMGSYDASSAGGAHWQLYESGGAIKLSDGSTTITTSITGIEDNAWHHIVLTRSGSTVTAYKDGSSVSTHTYAVDFPSPSTYLRIAQRGDGNQFCDVELDEMSFWSRTLTSTDVTGLYTNKVIDTIWTEEGT